MRQILVIDDDPTFRRLVRSLLERGGYEVMEAEDGAEGFERLLAERPPIVVSDWAMPNMNGLEFVQKVRAAELDWYPYILVMTASGEQPGALDAGADDFINKLASRSSMTGKPYMVRLSDGETLEAGDYFRSLLHESKAR